MPVYGWYAGDEVFWAGICWVRPSFWCWVRRRWWWSKRSRKRCSQLLDSDGNDEVCRRWVGREACQQSSAAPRSPVGHVNGHRVARVSGGFTFAHHYLIKLCSQCKTLTKFYNCLIIYHCRQQQLWRLLATFPPVLVMTLVRVLREVKWAVTLQQSKVTAEAESGGWPRRLRREMGKSGASPARRGRMLVLNWKRRSWLLVLTQWMTTLYLGIGTQARRSEETLFAGLNWSAAAVLYCTFCQYLLVPLCDDRPK